jgi:hypothetical protein
MRNPDDSWWLKVKRAEHHVKDLERLLGPYEAIGPYTVSESLEGKPKQYVYRAWIDIDVHPPINPEIAIVLGDFLGNLRAALDHMRVALVPKNRRGNGRFPIFAEDFRVRCETCGQQLKRHARDEEHWNSCVAGMEQMAIDYILARQPFQTQGASGDVSAERHSLAILNSLRNADEHRDLVPIVAGIRVEEIHITELDGTPIDEGKDSRGYAGEDGAEIARSERKVKVEAEGSVVVKVRTSSGDLYFLPDACFGMLRWIGGEILPTLDTFVPS